MFLLLLIVILVTPIVWKLIFWRCTRFRYRHLPQPSCNFISSALFLPHGGLDILTSSMKPASSDLFYQGMYLDGSHVVGVVSPDAFKQILSNVKAFPKLPSTYDVVQDIVGSGIVTAVGQDWKMQRKVLSPLIHFNQVQAYVPIILRSVDAFITKYETNGLIEINSTSETTSLSLSIILASMFGHIEQKTIEDEYRVLGKLFMVDWAFSLVAGVFKYILWTPYWIFGLPSLKATISRLRKAVSLHVNHLKASTKGYETCLVTKMLQANASLGAQFKDQLIADNCLTFMFAGEDTTSGLLAWTIQCLAEHLDVQRKVQEEVDGVALDSIDLTHQLPYTKAVISEVLRLYPPVPFLDRYAANGCTISGVYIPKGTMLRLFFICAHRDPRNWEDPLSFQPERFMHPKSRHPFAFVPFSASSRNCVGRNLALVEAVLTIAALIQRFRFSLRARGSGKMEIIMVPHGMKAELRRRPETSSRI